MCLCVCVCETGFAECGGQEIKVSKYAFQFFEKASGKFLKVSPLIKAL